MKTNTPGGFESISSGCWNKTGLLKPEDELLLVINDSLSALFYVVILESSSCLVIGKNVLLSLFITDSFKNAVQLKLTCLGPTLYFRVHQRSVEVARQRLEEYQRALQIRYNMTATKMPPAVVPAGLIPPPLQNTQPAHPPAPLPLFTPPSVPVYIHTKPQPFVEVPTRESDMSASPPHLPSSSLRVCSRLQAAEAESLSNSLRSQRPDASAWLTENIMERVTGHLPDRVRPSSATKEPHKLITTRHSASVPLLPTSDPIRALSPSITGTTPLLQSRAVLQPATSSHDSLHTGSLSPRDKDMERQRRELQEVQRRLQEQREAVVLQQRQQEEERQRREMQEVQRRLQEQREVMVLQQRRQQEEEEEERQRREMQEVQRRVQEQREAVVLQQRQQEEERQRQEVEMTHIRRQKETLQALIQTDAPVSVVLLKYSGRLLDCSM